MPHSSRRTVLVAAAAVFAGAAAGIAVNAARTGPPTVQGRPSAAPLATPTPRPGEVEGTRLLSGLQALAETDQNNPAAEQIARAHLAHRQALLSPNPAMRPSAEEEPPEAEQLDDQPDGLADAERAATEQFGEWTIQSTGGLALFWGSVAAYSAAVPTLLGVENVPESSDPGTGPLAQIDPETAIGELVSQTHAAVFAYQRLLGIVPRDQDEPIVEALERYRELRDELSAELVERDASVPPAEAGYAAPDDPDEASREIETGLLPYLGQWLQAAETPVDRERAAELLRATAVRAVDLGAPLPAWPGWPD